MGGGGGGSGLLSPLSLVLGCGREMGDYLHLWKVIGHLSGIAPRYNAHMDSVEEARMMLESIGAHQVAPDTSAPGMTWHVLECVSYRPPLPRTYAEMVAVSRLMAGDTYADAIGIPSMDDPRLYPTVPPLAATPKGHARQAAHRGVCGAWSLQRVLFLLVATAYAAWGAFWAACCGRSSSASRSGGDSEQQCLQARKAQATAGAGAILARLRIASALASWPLIGGWLGWTYWRFTDAAARTFLGGRTTFPLRMLPKRVSGVAADTPHSPHDADSGRASGGGVCPMTGMSASE
jgi:hypothetical protein